MIRRRSPGTVAAIASKPFITRFEHCSIRTRSQRIAGNGASDTSATRRSRQSAQPHDVANDVFTSSQRARRHDY
jgi:hypothetical protein